MARTNLTLSFLSHQEFSQLIVNLLKDWQESHVTIEDPILTKLKTRLTKELEVFQAGLATVKDSLGREDLATADKTRDLDLAQLADLVKLGKYAKTPEEKEAFRRLSPLFKTVSQVKKANYEVASAFITSLLSQLKTADYQTHLRSLNLTKAVASLTKSQTDFEALVQKTHGQNQTKVHFDNKSNRKALQNTYKRLGDYLYIMAEESNLAAYPKLYKVYTINSDYFKPLARKTKAKTKLDPDSPAVNPETTDLDPVTP